MSPLVLLEREGGVAVLTLDDPRRRNAMTEAMGESFAARVRELAAEPPRAVVLTGAGAAFCAGGDLDMLERRAAQASADPGGARRAVRSAMRDFYELFLGVRNLPCPSIAALNGAAIGAGLCLALACDLRLASRDARLTLNFTQLGIHPGMAATWTLPRLVGAARAAELLYTGRPVSGEEAERIGLVNRACDARDLLPAARSLASEIAETSPLANRAIKRALARSPAATLEDQIGFEATEQALSLESRDFREGLDAARARRRPRFHGH